MSPPKEKGALQHAPLFTKLAPTEYPPRRRTQARCEIRWWREARRILAEYERTGNPVHLRALRVHCAAMRARLRETETVK